MFHLLNFILSFILSAYAILYYDFYVTNPVDLFSFFVYTDKIPPITYSYFILIKFLIIFVILFCCVNARRKRCGTEYYQLVRTTIRVIWRGGGYRFFPAANFNLLWR